MIFQIPVSAKQVDPNVPLGDPPVPLNDLVVELFWVRTNGTIAKEFGRAPVVNGVAHVEADPCPAQLAGRFGSRRPACRARYFDPGRCAELFPPPSPIHPTGRVSLLASSACFSLNAPLSDGAVEIVAQDLQHLPSPLEFTGVDLAGDASGNYVITVRGKKRFFFFFKLPFTYRRSVHLQGNMAPGQTGAADRGQLVGAAQITGANVQPQAATLDRMIKDAVEHQLDVAVTRIANLVLELTHSSFSATTVSASEVRVSWFPTVPEVQACMTISGGAITGIVVPPPFDLAVCGTGAEERTEDGTDDRRRTGATDEERVPVQRPWPATGLGRRRRGVWSSVRASARFKLRGLPMRRLISLVLEFRA